MSGRQMCLQKQDQESYLDSLIADCTDKLGTECSKN